MRNVRSASLIIVADDDHVGAAQTLSIFGAPLICAAWIARRREPKLAEIVRILLTLHDNY